MTIIIFGKCVEVKITSGLHDLLLGFSGGEWNKIVWPFILLRVKLHVAISCDR